MFFFVTFSESMDVKRVWDVKCVGVFVTFSGTMDVKRVSDVKCVLDIKCVSDVICTCFVFRNFFRNCRREPCGM